MTGRRVRHRRPQWGGRPPHCPWALALHPPPLPRRTTSLQLLGLLLALAWPAQLAAQVHLVAAGLAGVSIDIDDNDPVTGGGFAFLTEAGVGLRRIEFGAEVGQHRLGKDRKASQFGAYARFTAPLQGGVVPYLVAGLAQYRYSPVPGGPSHAFGGSLGPGLLFRFGEEHVGLLLEARFHTSFERLRVISSQDFLGISAGVRFAL